MEGGKALEQKLLKIARDMAGTVRVGFLESATYPDGKSVAEVAFFNEFGTQKIPTRPYFRTMIAEESTSWPKKLSAAAKFTQYDGKKSLAMMGEDIKGALTQSIVDWREPPNAESTEQRKGFNKPLIHTSHMKNSIDFEVTE